MVHGHFSSSDSVANIFGNWLHGIEYFLRWERLSLFGLSSYFEMIKSLLTNFFSLTGHLPVYRYASFMVDSTAYGEP
jgi:hypothetical protein